jgi:hypothetical protein
MASVPIASEPTMKGSNPTAKGTFRFMQCDVAI